MLLPATDVKSFGHVFNVCISLPVQVVTGQVMLAASALFVASVVMNAGNANMVILFFILVIFWFVEIKKSLCRGSLVPLPERPVAFE